MDSSQIRQRARRKLERLVNRPLASLRPRLHRALGITALGDALARGSGTVGYDGTPDRRRVSGCPSQETTARLQREIGP